MVMFSLSLMRPARQTFSGDQINPKQKRQLSAYFSAEYVFGNLADVIAVLIMPLMRCKFYSY